MTAEIKLQNISGGNIEIISVSEEGYSGCTINGSSSFPLSVNAGELITLDCTAPEDYQGSISFDYRDYAGLDRTVTISGSGSAPPESEDPMPPEPEDPMCTSCSCSGSSYETITCGDNEDTVYVDCDADLCWTPTAGSGYIWDDAITYCDSTQNNYGGKTDWTLPDKTTLENLCNSDSCSVTCFGGDGSSLHYWSSTEVDALIAYNVIFTNCFVYDYLAKSSTFYARCVRSGSSP